ncbi:MAG TPA: tetratricopeptide repeat protein [Blastocatellia bacterium]|nr:tetratricopeptide repeat protein [Blastocatellia bacterium]
MKPKYSRALLTGLTLISLLFTLGSQAKQDAPSPLQIAEEAFSKGDYKKAKEQFELAFMSGTSLEAGTGLAETLLKLDDWKGARDTAMKAMRIRSTSADATAIYADALFRGGDLNDAGLHYLRALSLDQQNARALVGLAVMKLSRGENSEALSYLRDAIAAAPQTARAYYWMGVVFQNEGRCSEAADAYEKFLSFKQTGYPENLLSGLDVFAIPPLRSLGQATPFAVSGPSTISIPFDFSQNVPVITAVANGITVKLLVDMTIQNFVYYDSDSISKIKATKFTTHIAEHGADLGIGISGNLRVGDLTVTNIPVLSANRVMLEQDLDKKLTGIDGAIGLTWLRSSVVTFDYQNHTLTISPPSFADSSQRLIAPKLNGAAPKVSLRLPFQLINGKIVLPASIGDTNISVLLATGQVNSTVSADFANNNFKPEEIVKSGDANYVKSMVLNFGGQEIASPNVDISQKLDDVSKRTGVQFGAALGQQFLRNLSKLSVDFANMIVTFEIDQSKPAK